jgi:hypothetical protein
LRSKTKRQGIEKLQDCGHVARGKDYVVAQAGLCICIIIPYFYTSPLFTTIANFLSVLVNIPPTHKEEN